MWQAEIDGVPPASRLAHRDDFAERRRTGTAVAENKGKHFKMDTIIFVIVHAA